MKAPVRVLLVASALATVASLMPACDAEEQGTQSATLTACPATNVIDEPPQFPWTYHPASGNTEAYYSGTLELGEATFTIGGETLTTRAYRAAGGSYSIPGPTLNMAPGNKYILQFSNLLPYEVPSTSHNVFKDPNVTNVHTHGLHISGESPSDDVTRVIEGGFGGDYVYDIPADHMGGTYWYHAHHHGSTMLQISGGAFGQIIIDDSNDGIPANVAAMPERQLVVAYLDPGAAGTGGDTLMSGTLAATWTVNGLKGGDLCTTANEWQHWRVLLADRNASEKTISVGSNCEVQLLARDGVWRTTAPKALSTGSISLTGASRADLAVRCSNDSTLSVNNAVVANILASGSGNPDVGPFSNGSTGTTWSAIRPSYLRDLSGVTNVHNESIRMGARTVNGTKFDADVPNIALAATDVQEWSLSGNTQHPFHLHVYHVQAVNCGGSFEPGEYYDVVSQACSVRFDLNAATSEVFEGRTIMHCHILEHEDQGAMGWLDVMGGIAPPTFPANTSYSAKYALDVPAPFCGDATCNAGESTCSCSADCGTPPSTETSCSDGVDEDCDGLTDCADSDCSADSACAAPPTCGDASCDLGEDSCSCSADCGTPPSAETSCSNGLDEDCDGVTDCADSDCSGAPECSSTTTCGDGVCEVGEDCNTCGSDCASKVGGQPSTRYCCGDGVAQSAEGNGSICDGNY